METDSGTLWRSPDGARPNLACAATGPLRGRRGFGVGELGLTNKRRVRRWRLENYRVISVSKLRRGCYRGPMIPKNIEDQYL